MTPSRSGIRLLAWAIALLSLVATALTLILAFNLTGAPPVISETADFPTRILESQAFQASRWPIDLAGSLLFVAAFGGLLVLGPLLTARTGRPEIGALLGAGGTLGMLSQLVHVGATQMVVSIGYCDCGFKTQEVISQAWGLTLAAGVADWFLLGAFALFAVGVVVAARTMAGRSMPSAWGPLSWLLAAVLGVAVMLGVAGIDGDLPSLLVPLASGALLPIWAGWLATGLTEQPAATAAE